MKAITQLEFEKRINERYPNENFIIIEYTNSSNPLKIQCLQCKQIFTYPQAKNFLAKNKKAGCSECNGLRAKNKRNILLLKEKYIILDENINNAGKILYTCQCKRCGRISTHALVSFLENTCRCEGKGNRWTEEEIKTALFNEYGNEYRLLSPFQTVNDKSLFQHSCGFIWSVTPARILYNRTGCPKCCKIQSKGCKIIERQLQKLNLSFEKEKFLENSLQRFDFYLEFNGNKFAIEYNGEQHYKYNPFFHGRDIEVFKKYQERDKRKKLYCEQNNIHLVIIPYTLAKEEIIAYINKLFSSSTTSPMDVSSSELK